MKNKIEDLRNHLFAALESLADKEEPMEIARAKAISDVAQTIINSAKVEVDYIKQMGGRPVSGFIPDESSAGTPPLRAIGSKP
ncbi:hypothetical protein EAH88_11645 [Rhodanobacter glycinis]|uniref:Uncharacterized protein n=1 Tax=Rhodanobacter glycinis TaxID=582702 RepID=A0A502C658_9GAMM|nr:hypothetical protein [Rhodanobacter glycinis]TPG08282.1 hypothetical protein EAH88_11645 [Rhodanobacter glycinis]